MASRDILHMALVKLRSSKFNLLLIITHDIKYNRFVDLPLSCEVVENRSAGFYSRTLAKLKILIHIRRHTTNAMKSVQFSDN